LRVVLVLVFSMALIAWTDFVLVPNAPISHLYYVPILIAAIRLGRRSAIGVAMLAAVFAHLADPERSRFHYDEADVMELLLYMTVAIVASRLACNAAELRRLASTDDLTGLHNLRSFEGLCRELLERHRGTQTSIALLCLDVDRLKPLNDTFGHLTGADAVKWVGRVIRNCLPSGAYACRYGGDEFAVVMTALDASSTTALSACIQSAVSKQAPVLDGRAFPPGTLSVSIGSASSVAMRVQASDTAALFTVLFREADRAMYENKRLRKQAAPRAGAFVAVPVPSAPLPPPTVAQALRTAEREPSAAWSCVPSPTREEGCKPPRSSSGSK
jgi:diguanylate cyclase (GGDEF)-like protein